MSLNPLYIIASDLQEFFIDKDTGLPMANGTLTFFRDNSRTTPKTVYELTGTPPNYSYTALPNPLYLSSVGTVMDSGGNDVVIYYYPWDQFGNLDLYYVVCANAGSIEQFTRQGWPNITAENDTTQTSEAIENQIANPQFTQNFLNVGVAATYTVSSASSQVFEFAPDWNFIISGTGTVIVQVIAVAGDANILTSPPYVLDVNVSSGITACYLTQRFYNNSGLWASTATNEVFLSGYMVAINENVGTTGLSMFYNPSSGGTPVQIVNAAFDNTGYVALTGTTADPIPLSTDVNTGSAGYTDIYIAFNATTHVRLSSIQVVPIESLVSGALVSFDLQSANRAQALMGDYYIPHLEHKRIPSLLTGWDFSLNPTQFGASGTMSSSAGYIWDQTIALDLANSVTYTQNAINNALQVTTVGTSSAFYIMQYLSGAQVSELIGSKLSVNIDCSRTSAGSDITYQIYCCVAPSTSTIPTLPTSIGTVSTSGVFTLTAAGWTLIPRNGLPTASGIIPVISANTGYYSDNATSFSGWQLTSNTVIGNTTYFAIVVTFAYATAANVATIKSVSVNLGEIATRPAPLTLGQTISACNYYYQKSFPQGTTPAQNAGVAGASFGYQVLGSAAAGAGGPIAVFKNTMRVSPTVTAFNPSAANAQIRNIAQSSDWSGTTVQSANVNGFYTTGTTAGGSGANDVSGLHWTADSRLGIV